MKINVRESIRLPADENSRFRQVRHHDGQKVEKQRKENRMQGAMPISMATVGTAYTIKKISGNTEVRSHLKSMGFNEGTEVKLITQREWGYSGAGCMVEKQTEFRVKNWNG